MWIYTLRLGRKLGAVHHCVIASKTCTNCGELHRNLGGSKTFCCPKCKVVLDRDANGARNILLKFLTEHEMAGNPAMGPSP